MHVAFLSKSHPVMGGVESWLDDLVAGLQARGLRCSVGLAHGARFHDAWRYAQAHPQLPWQPLQATTGSAAGRRLAVERALRRLRPDVVVPVMLHDALAVACAAGPRLGLRVLYPVHEVNPGIGADLRAFAPHMAAAVAVDPGSRDLVRAHAPSLPLHTIPCGVPAAAASSGVGPRPRPVIGLCGRLENQVKRVLDLVPVMIRLARAGQEAELWIAGEGNARQPLLTALAGAGVGQQVRDLGRLSRARLYREFYPRLDVLLLFSDTETGPLVAFEAMAHGVAVVCADFRGRAEAAALRHEENCLLFPVGDTAAAADAVLRLLREPPLARRLGVAAAAEVRASRDLERSVQAWHDLIRHTAAQPPPAAAPSALPGAPERIKEQLRRLLGRRFPHTGARAEWPFYGPADGP